MKTKVIFITLFLTILNSNSIEAQWWHIPNFIGFNIQAVYCKEKNDVFVLAEHGNIYHTTNEGLSWGVTSTGGIHDLYDITFADSNNGWAVGFHDIVHTSNRGLSWELQYNANEILKSVSFADSNHGVVVGDQGKIFWTTNGGITWVEQSLNPDNYLRDVYMADTIAATVLGREGIFKTSNGGETWTQQSNMNSLSGMSFINSDYGFAVGSGSKILKTTNGGAWWTMQNISGWDYLNDVCFTDSNNGTIVGGSGTTFKTTDGGENWIRYQIGSSAFLTSVSFTDENYGWASGLNAILKTTNGGVTFLEEPYTKSQIEEYLLSQNYPNPFNPITKISWQTPVSGWQTLKVYDVLGNEVATLVNEYRSAGSYEVEFKSTVGSHQVANGVYFYRLQAGEYIETKKMVLLK